MHCCSPEDWYWLYRFSSGGESSAAAAESSAGPEAEAGQRDAKKEARARGRPRRRPDKAGVRRILCLCGREGGVIEKRKKGVFTCARGVISYVLDWVGLVNTRDKQM